MTDQPAPDPQKKRAWLKQIPAFGATGGAGLLVNVAVTALCKQGLGLPIELAYVAGYLSAVMVGFLLCRHVVFKSKEQSAARQLTVFFVSSLVFRGMEYVSSLLLVKEAGAHYIVAILITTLIFFAVKFIYYRSVVFRRKEET